MTPATINFQNESEHVDAYYWDFGDGRSSIQENPSISYDEYGTYTVTLVATNNTTAKSDTARRDLTITPGKVFIDYIRIEDIPFTDANGAGWDLSSGPDFYFLLTDNDDNIILRSSTVVDLAPSNLPISFYTDPPYEIQIWDEFYWFELYDADDISADDYMGLAGFRIDSIVIIEGYIEEYKFENASGSIEITLVLTWE